MSGLERLNLGGGGGGWREDSKAIKAVSFEVYDVNLLLKS